MRITSNGASFVENLSDEYRKGRNVSTALGEKVHQIQISALLTSLDLSLGDMFLSAV